MEIKPEEKPRSSRTKTVAVGLILLAIGAGVYLFIKKVAIDRESAMNFQPHPTRVRVENNGKPVTRTYTAQEIEEARRQGKKLPGLDTSPAAMPGAQAGEAAVQRSLRTLEEINRINEMNRRLIEQQQRQQQQQR